MQTDANDAKEKEKAKEKAKEKEKENNPLPPLHDCGQALQDAFADWLLYKKERREGYKPTGLRNLETQVRNNAREYGEDAVVKLIRYCMASNWAGIIFDRLKNSGGGERHGASGNPGESKDYGIYL